MLSTNTKLNILVGGMAVKLHGYVRTTGDMEVWVNQTKENYQKVVKAFEDFGMPVFDMTEENFLSSAFDVWSFGINPIKIEIMTSVKGLRFEDSYKISQLYSEDNISIRYLHLNSRIDAKKASGRHKDLDDLEQLGKN